MTKAQLNSPFESIAKRIDPQAKHVRHWPLTGGVSAQLEAIEYEFAEGADRRVVVRQHGAAEWKQLEDDVTATEFSLQTTLFQRGFPVPEPLFLDVSCSVLPSPYLVMPMVEGTTEVDETRLEDVLHQMADFLLRLHNLETEILNVTRQLPHGDNPVKGALEYVPDTASNALLRAALSSWVTKPSGTSLLHGDFWPGNILWSDNEIAAVIDWEDASIGAVESDLAGCRSEILVMFGEPAMEAFTQRYLSGTTREITDLPVWEVYASFAALSTMSEWGLPQEVEATRRERTAIFAERAAREVIDRA
ncbi:MAG: phosphotransferase family protein [Phormidesmis sp.]